MATPMPMPMRCLSLNQPPNSRDHKEPTTFEWQAAQARVAELYKIDRGQNPVRMEVFTERSDTQGGYANVQVSGCTDLNKVLQGLTTDFNKNASEWRGRKPDVMGITCDGRNGKLLEVTTFKRVDDAARQLQEKLGTLQGVSKRLQHAAINFLVEWKAADWRPARDMVFYAYYPPPGNSKTVTFNEAGVARWICYQPTYDLSPPPGVILYEIHQVEDRQPTGVPVPFPQDVEGKIKEEAQKNRPTSEMAESWAQQFLARYPDIAKKLKEAAYMFGAAVVITALIVLLVVYFGPPAAAVAMFLVIFAAAPGRV